MSRVDITDLVPGTAATSAAVNATMTSWNTATAAGGILAVNVRQEGIDRRTLAAENHACWTTDGNTVISSGTSSGSVSNVSGSYVVVPTGTNLTMTADMSPATSSRILLHASVYLEAPASASGGAIPRVWLALQQSTDGGAVWATLAGTEQIFEVRDLATTAAAGDWPTARDLIPGIVASPTWCRVVVPTGGNMRFRVGYQTQNGNVAFINGVLFTEVFKGQS